MDALPSPNPVRETMDAAPFPSSAAIWEQIDIAESNLVCCMFEEAASVASSVIQRLCTYGLTVPIEDAELVNIMESIGMVFIQSLKELGRTSKSITELKKLFGTVAAVPGQVFITGACMQIAEGSISTLRASFDEFLGKWKYVGHNLLFLDEEAKRSLSTGIRWPCLSIEKYLDIVEVYAISMLAMALNDIDLAVSWTEKAELPEERRQEILRRLHSFCSAKDSSSPVTTVNPQGELSVSRATEKFTKDLKHPNDIPKSVNSASFYQYLFNHMASRWFQTIHWKGGHMSLILPRGRVMVWSSLFFFICYVLRKKRATLQRIVARQGTYFRRALVDAWQLAFSVQVNPLAAIQQLPSAPQGQGSSR